MWKEDTVMSWCYLSEPAGKSGQKVLTEAWGLGEDSTWALGKSIPGREIASAQFLRQEQEG